MLARTEDRSMQGVYDCRIVFAAVSTSASSRASSVSATCILVFTH